MIDLHMHTIFSDGVLIPSELARRAEHKGLAAIAITDHGDSSNIDFILPRIVDVAEELNNVLAIQVIPGIEITHVHPSLIAGVVIQARSLGARIVVVHGETLAEPVAPGTNRAAIDAGVDILAHPGLITEDEVMAAKKNNVLLEISARAGHSLANGHVAALAKKHGAGMVINTDTHAPSDLIDHETARRIVRGAGLSDADFEAMQKNAAAFLQ
ncbi:histidinol phosphate phosphatase domain-containing protein [Desulfosudis oleivorans]|uniref:PHP domain protein n=1 Tax=Desulfosudis oleivorans (strain DSM 6200 / JCM 39069 / Hxd3) TaxID=96561 RepID=A8ZVH0_DESOH|nr:histidinol phosphate phosphatase domain-containing protein [Desulfosudis oleivorans]ABW68157.1 PHP domain protein [Desulfosudis oleivorans Hxd3]